MRHGAHFSGIDGFGLAAHNAGMQNIWATEIDPFCIRVSKERFPTTNHLGNITNTNGYTLEPVDIITFGSPCQNLSVAGKREGLAGKQSSLFMEAIRTIREMRDATNGMYPRFVVWENVPGAFYSNKGRDFKSILEAFTEAEIPMPASGRWSKAGMVRGNGREIAWRCLDAQYWGIPQRRKRIFLVADFAGGCAGEILFESQGVSRNFTPGGNPWKGTATRTGNSTTSAGQTITSAVTSKWANSTSRPSDDKCHNLVVVNSHRLTILENYPTDSRVKVDESGTIQTLTSRMGTGRNNVPLVMEHSKQIGQNISHNATTVDCRNLCENEELCGTLQSKSNGGYSLNYQNPVRIGYLIRKLTPLECERLMGFKDDWTNIPGASDTARYRALGNSVAIPCVEWLMKRIKRGR